VSEFTRRRPGAASPAAGCPGRNPPPRAVERPARPRTTAVERIFTTGETRGPLEYPGRPRTAGCSALRALPPPVPAAPGPAGEDCERSAEAEAIACGEPPA
jgi:hypothetical protein